MIQLCCENLSVRCIWLCVLIMSRTSLRVNFSDWPVWVFVCELSGCGFESHCNHLNFRFRACFKQGVPWYSGNCRVRIHSETRTWCDKNIQSGILQFYALISLPNVFKAFFFNLFATIKTANCFLIKRMNGSFFHK